MFLKKFCVIFFIISNFNQKVSLSIDKRGDGENFIEGDKLLMNQCLERGLSMMSENRKCYINMQKDGNLVIYRTSGISPIWNTKTDRTDANCACMQEDGNFIVLGNDDKIWWSSKTEGKNGTYVKLQKSGNFEMFTESDIKVWESGSKI